MKPLALLLITGALCLYGSTFTGIWTAPGLESLPTYDTALDRTPWMHLDKPEAPTGITAVSSTLAYRPAGVATPWGDRPMMYLPPTPLLKKFGDKDATSAAKKPPSLASLPPRWYTTNPLPPKPEPKTIRPTGGSSANSRVYQTSASGGRASSGSSRSRNYSTSRQRSSRVRASGSSRSSIRR